MEKLKKIKEFRFKYDKKKFKAIIEKEIPKEGKVKVRLIEERPKVKKIRTRYEPQIEMFGDEDAFVPIKVGYNPKSLRNSKLLFLLFTFLIGYTIYLFLPIPIQKTIIEIPISSTANIIKSESIGMTENIIGNSGALLVEKGFNFFYLFLGKGLLIGILLTLTYFWFGLLAKFLKVLDIEKTIKEKGVNHG